MNNIHLKFDSTSALTNNQLIRYLSGTTAVTGTQIIDDGTTVNIVDDTFYVNNSGVVSSFSGYSINSQLFISSTPSFLGTKIGYQAGLALVYDNNSVFIGRSAGKSFFGTSSNVAIGSDAWSTQTNNGGQVVAIGYLALMSDNGGNQNNTAIGFACASNTTAPNEITAVGAYALYDSISGQRQLAIGAEALRFSNGDFNFGIGRRAGYDLSGGSQNVMIGNNVGGGLISGDNNVVIGGMISSLPSGMSNAIILGDGNGSRFLSNNLVNNTDVILGLNQNLHSLGSTAGTLTIVGSANLPNFTGASSDNAHAIVGYGHFSKLTGGGGAIALGSRVNMQNTGSYNHVIGIGTDVVITASNQMVVGGQFSGIDNVYLGHGVANPDANLYVGGLDVGNVTKAAMVHIKSASSGTTGFRYDGSTQNNIFYANDNGNIGFNGNDFQDGIKVTFISSASTIPTTNPVGGVIQYVEVVSGQTYLKYRDNQGNVITI